MKKLKTLLTVLCVGSLIGALSACNPKDDNTSSEVESHSHVYENNVCTSCGEKKPSEGLQYTLSANNSAYTVVGVGACLDTEIVIPSAYNGLPVTAIGERAFAHKSALTSVEIPSSVISVGGWAFSYSTALINVKIGNGVTSIGEGAFVGCAALASVEIPNSVTNIGNDAFWDCISLTSVVIPDSVTSIGEGLFLGCTVLESVTLPSGITSIGNNMFKLCKALTDFVIPSTVSHIGNEAFASCDAMTSIVIPASVGSIGWGVFGSLTNVYYQGTASEWAAVSIGEQNEALLDATVYYYSETEPMKDGNWWHYVDNVATAWDKLEAKATTFALLKTYIENGVSEICIAADIELTETVYVASNTTLYTEGEFTLKRAASFLGDLFVIGQTESGENVVMDGTDVELHLRANEGATLTIDGNKAEVTGDVAGTAFMVLNSAQLYVNDGVIITNHKKSGNAFLLEDAHNVSTPEKVGGAAVIIVNGTFHMYGGVIRDCEVMTDDENASRGGAIFNYGTFKMYDGVIENCQGGRGGAIYNYRITYVYGGEIKNNYAGVYAGAIYLHNSQYSYATLGEVGEDIQLYIEGNTSKKSGGAIFIPQQATVYVQGGTEFKQNSVQSGNGGAMNVAGALVVEYALFTENTASSKGGAIYGYYNETDNTARIIQLKKGVFTGNSAPRGGAVALGKGDDVETGAYCEIGDVLFEENTANYDTSDKYGYGGAVHVDDGSTVTVTGSPTFKKNVAAANGGALYLTKSSNFLAEIPEGETLTFTENAVTNGNGGAVYNSGSTLKLYAMTGNNVVLEKNKATSECGGAIAVHSEGVVQLYAVAFDGNTAAEDGGAIYLYGGSAVIGDENNQTESVFKNNTAKRGGAIFISTSKSASAGAQVYALTANSNTTSGGGGAIYVTVHESAAAGLTAIFNAEVLNLNGNTAGGNGGAMYIYTSATVNIGRLTATNNNADGKYGGVAYVSGAATCVIDSITASGNSASKGGCMYVTTTDTVLTLNSGNITGNTATMVDSGNAIWVNSKNSILTVKAEVTYTDGEIQGASGFKILT